MTSPDGFEAWLKLQGYRESTILTSAREMRRLRRLGLREDTSESELELAVLRRYTAYLEEVGPGNDFDDLVLGLGLEPSKERKQTRRRARTARSFTERDWGLLVSAVLSGEEPEDRVLELQIMTGYRIGDFLRLRRSVLLEAFRSGVVVFEVKGGGERQLPLEGALESWEKLRKAWTSGATLADWVCAGGGRGGAAGWGAYKRVQRRLYAYGRTLGLEPPVHLHRLRRTVAVRALRETEDIHLVSQLLGHQSITATQIYVDEARLSDLTRLQQKLREKKGQ